MGTGMGMSQLKRWRKEQVWGTIIGSHGAGMGTGMGAEMCGVCSLCLSPCVFIVPMALRVHMHLSVLQRSVCQQSVPVGPYVFLSLFI